MKRFFKRLFWVAVIFFVARATWNHWGNPANESPKKFSETYKERLLPSSDDKPLADSKVHASEKSRDRFAKIDRHARNAPASAETTVESLAEYLQKGTRNDLEKARAIYVWLTENVTYDDESYNSGGYGATSAEGVLAARTAVCSGYSALYQALGEAMGLDIRTVGGYAKGYSYVPGTKLKKSDHAWNVIRIEGKWRIFDATWGAGNGTTVNGKLQSKKEFDEFWFDVSPYASIFSHFPEEAEYALVEPAISLEDYQNFPHVRKAYFKLGFDPRETYQKVYHDHSLVFPEVYDHKIPVEVLDSPEYGVLEKGRAYHFKFHAPEADHAAITGISKDWIYLKKERGNFYAVVKPQRTGTLSVNFKKGKKDGRFETVLKYKVVSKKVPI